MSKTDQRLLAIGLMTACLMIGCDAGRQPAPRRSSRGSQHTRTTQASRPKPTADPRADSRKRATTHQDASQDASSDASNSKDPDRPRRRTLAEVFRGSNDSAARWLEDVPRLTINERKVAAAGIRKLQSKRLALYTDLPVSDEIDQYPEMFDQAFAQWCAYFHVEEAEYADWRLTGFLMKDKARFWNAGLLPSGLPPFKNGFAQNFEFWLYDQTSDYYRRHLLLHEGTHGFMNTTLGACGPPWYMEGIAELLSTHHWDGKQLTLGYMPPDRGDVPGWERIRLVKNAIAEGRPMRLQDVVDYSVTAHIENEPYAWCWALALLLDRHPRYQERFRSLWKIAREPDFNARFRELMGDDWQALSEEWQVLTMGLEYGYDVPAMAIDFTPGKPMPAEGARVTVAAKGGWQNTGVQLEAGVTYEMRATGRYQVADKPQIWWSEPGGVSIRYYQGRPLGLLLAALRPDRPEPNGTSALLRPAAVGRRLTLTPKQTGTLYFRINDSAAELDDNAGELTVAIRRVQ